VTRRAELAGLGAVVLVTVAAFADVLFAGRSFYVRDFARDFVPAYACFARIVRSGSFPFWNPWFAGGQPLAANPRYAALYPLQWIAAAFGTRNLCGLAVAHFLIAAVGMFCFLRALRLRVPAAAFGAVTLALSGIALSLSNVVTVLFGFAWWPWLALFAHRYFEARRPRDLALASLVLGVILLTGDQSMILQAGALLAAYSIAKRNFRAAVIIGALGLLIGAAQIVPALDHARDAGRGAISHAEAAVWSLRAARPLELILPNLFSHFTPDAIYFWGSKHPSGLPWLFSFYFGLFAAALVVAGFIRRIDGWRFAAIVAIASYVIALAQPLYVPFVRYPEKFFIGGCFVLIVFSAIAADRFLDDALFRRTTFFVSLGFVVAAAIGLAFAFSPLFVRVWGLHGYIADALREARSGAEITLATTIALALILAVRENARMVLPLLGIFVIADLLPRSPAIAPRIDDSLYDPPPIARALPPGARVCHDADWQILYLRDPPRLTPEQRWVRVRHAMLPHLPALWGFHGVLEEDVPQTDLPATHEMTRLYVDARMHRDDLVQLLLALNGVDVVVVLRDPASPLDPIRIVPLGNPRWTFADQLATPSHIADAHRWSPHVAFVDAPFAPAAGRIVRASERANAIDLDVETPGDAALVVAVTAHKYWRATIDGNPAAAVRANVAFQALTIPRGRHHVAMRYSNPLLIGSGIVSLVTALALAVVALRSKSPPRQSPR